MNKPVFWLYGNRHDCNKAWEGICAKVKEKTQSSELNIETIYCGFNPQEALPEHRWATVNDVVYILRHKDMFDKRPRVLKVFGLPENFSDLVNFFNIVNSRNVLVFWGPFGYIKPGSKRWVTAKTTKLYKTIKSQGKVFEYPIEVTAAQAGRRVVEIVELFGKKIEPEAVRLLVKSQGKNLDVLFNAVEKASIYEKSKKITAQTIGECCAVNFDDNVWQFIEDLDYRKADAALSYLQQFYEQPSGVGETFYGRVSRFFGALLQHFQMLMLLKDSCGNTIDPRAVDKRCDIFKKMTPSALRDMKFMECC